VLARHEGSGERSSRLMSTFGSEGPTACGLGNPPEESPLRDRSGSASGARSGRRSRVRPCRHASASTRRLNSEPRSRSSPTGSTGPDRIWQPRSPRSSKSYWLTPRPSSPWSTIACVARVRSAGRCRRSRRRTPISEGCKRSSARPTRRAPRAHHLGVTGRDRRARSREGAARRRGATPETGSFSFRGSLTPSRCPSAASGTRRGWRARPIATGCPLPASCKHGTSAPQGT
jgi:hypothetical protein